jgi:hypothetical protein
LTFGSFFGCFDERIDDEYRSTTGLSPWGLGLTGQPFIGSQGVLLIVLNGIVGDRGN